MLIRFLLISSLMVMAFACQEKTSEINNFSKPIVFHLDKPFIQEDHVAYRVSDEIENANDVRSIAVADDGKVWIATADGIFFMEEGEAKWQKVILGDSRGPSYDVHIDPSQKVWLSTWDGVYSIHQTNLQKMKGPVGPIAKVLTTSKGVFALGPKGIWLYDGSIWNHLAHSIARSFRDARIDHEETLWLATDVGLYRFKDNTFRLYQDTSHLISCYVKGLDFSSDGKLWAGGLGGVTVRARDIVEKRILPQDGLPSAQVTTVRKAPDGRMWIGTENGISRFWPDSSNYSVLLSRRWLIDNEVRDIAFDRQGNAWVATAGGVSVIRRKYMSLSEKADYFYNVLISKHVREPWIVGHTKLSVPGDTNSMSADDDDNDGEYTSMYLAMESMRYAVNGDENAKERARKAFDFLQLLREVTAMDGFFARTIIPTDWTEMHDPNQKYSEKEKAEQLIRNPRNKIVEERWRLSKDGQWRWKGDTSSDEMCGHMFGYYFYYQYVADEHEKQRVAAHVSKIMDHLIAHDFNLTDQDGKHTKWGVWSPKILNHDPEWGPEKALNSLEILSFLKFTYHITEDEKYQKAYLHLIENEGYLENAKTIHDTNPAWFTYFDIYLAAYIYPALIMFEEDPELLETYQEHLRTWYQRHRVHDSPMINFMYNYLNGGNDGLASSIQFLQDAPLDLIDWNIDNASREDLKVIRKPVLEELQIAKLRPPSEYRTIRWDKNPYEAVVGNPYEVKEPVFWLFPYWLGRYLALIRDT